MQGQPPPTVPMDLDAGDEPTPQSDADRIRLKRLAKLQQQQDEQRKRQEVVPTIPQPASKPAVPVSRPSASISSQGSAPAAAPEAGPSKVPFKINIRPASKLSSTPAPSARPAESFEQWEAAVIGRILNVTLDQSKAEASSWQTTLLSDLRSELEEEEPGSSRRMRSDIADRLLISRLSLDPAAMSDDPVMLTVIASLPESQSVLGYLAGCWSRTNTERSRLVAARKGLSDAEVTERVGVIEKLKDLVISYAGLTIQDPSMFPNHPSLAASSLGAAEIAKLLLEPASGASHPLFDHVWGFIHDVARRFDGDGLEDILGPVVEAVARRPELVTKQWDLGGHEWREPVKVLGDLVEVKPVAAATTKLGTWWPATVTRGNMIEVQTLLGPVLALSTFPDTAPKIVEAYFKNSRERPQADINSATKSLQMTLTSVQTSLFNVFDRIVRSGAEPREAVLDFFAKSVALNTRRTAMRVDPRIVSSDGFMVNLQSILLGFAVPFLDSQYSKIDKVDPLYFLRSNRIDIGEETRINASKEEADAFAKKETVPAGTPPNFITEIFFLTAACFRLGLLKVGRDFENINRRVNDYKKRLKEVERDTSWVGGPQEAATRAGIDRMKAEVSRMESGQDAIYVQMSEPELLSKSTSFCTFLMTWCVRMVDPTGQHPRKTVELPLPDDCRESFKMLPEYILEDAIEHFNYVTRYAPQTLSKSSSDELLTFLLVFATTPYLRNFHLKSKFVEILYYNTRPIPDNRNGLLGDALNYHPLALKHLMPALMQIYVEVEITGTHTQFYDKFQSRRYISLLLRSIWQNPTHRQALQRESAKESFTRFANLLMNDVTYLLDDSLTQLQSVRKVEQLKANPDVWNSMTDEERKTEEDRLASNEYHCPYQLQLANENVNMLKVFTEETPNAFLKSEIVNRLAAMLDYNLDTMAGPKCQELKVSDPKKFHFQPKILLSDLLSIFLNLSGKAQFHAAIVNDGRSYRRELFERAIGIARRAGLKTDVELAKLEAMIDSVEELKRLEEEEENWDDVPDEFLDPIMSTFMKDPVILPTSKTTVDLSTIKQHFLSDPTDPFNRAPLKIEDVIPDVDLKSRIEEWLVAKRAAK